MKASSRTMMLAFGLALAMLAVSTLVAALNLSREAAVASQQAEVWRAYALSLHSRDVHAVRGAAVPALVPAYGPAANRPGRAAHPAPGFSF